MFRKVIVAASVLLFVGLIHAVSPVSGWRVIPQDAVYPTDDVIVAFCEVTDPAYNLPADPANSDCTAAFQAALNDASAAGGGTVFIPAGHYRIDGTLVIKANVILRGRWCEITASKPAAGTIIKTYETTQIKLTDSSSGVRDLTFWSPDQNPGSPSGSSFLIVSDGSLVTVENITFINTSNAVDMSNASMCCLRGLYGTPMKVGLAADKSYAVSRFDNINFTPDYWPWSKLPGSPSSDGAHKIYLKNNATAVNIKEMDGFYFVFSNISGYQTGIVFQTGISGDNPQGDIAYVSATDCAYALKVDDAKHLKILESTFEGTYGYYSAMGCDIIANRCRFEGGTNSIYAPSGGADINLMNCTLIGPTNASSLENLTSPTVIPTFSTSYDKVRKPATTDLFNVKDYGAVGNGTQDDTIAVQAAVAAANNNGGGIVFVPDGEYLMTGNLNVGAGVELRGNSGGRHIASNRKNGQLGTLFVIDVGRGSETGPAFVTLDDYAGIRGVSFHHLQQDYTNFQPYPYAIRANGIKNYIIDCSLSNPYQGMELNGDDHLVEYTFTGGLKRAFRANHCSGGRIQNLHIKVAAFWQDIWTFPHTPMQSDKAALKWKANEILETFYLNGCDNYSISSIFNHASHAFFTADNSSGQTLLISGEQIQQGYTIKNGSKTFNFLNSSANVNVIGDRTGTWGIRTLPGFKGQARYFNSSLWGTQDFTWDAQDGEIFLQQCYFSGSSDRGIMNVFCRPDGRIIAEAGYGIYFAIENEGTLRMTDFDFREGCHNAAAPALIPNNIISQVSILADVNQNPPRDYGLVLDTGNIVMEDACIMDSDPAGSDARRVKAARLKNGDFKLDVTDPHFSNGAQSGNSVDFRIRLYVPFNQSGSVDVYYDSTSGQQLGKSQSLKAGWHWINFTKTDCRFAATDDIRISVTGDVRLGMVCVRTPDLPQRKMNILFLVADDLNTWLLGDTTRYAGKVVAPNLTKLAESGVNFERAYTAAPVCSPSRTAFFSGVAPWKSGHYHNTPGANISEPLNNALSLASCFKKAGYYAVSYGKITHGWDPRGSWDEKIGHKRDPAPPGAPLTSVGKGEQDWGPIHLTEEEMNDTIDADYAIKQLEKKHDTPFFIAYGSFNPHMPWYVPKKYFDMFPLDDVTAPEIQTNDLDDVPPLGVELTEDKGKYVDAIFEHGLHKDGVRGYLATTAYADAQMGRVLDALEKSPYRDNTIVVFLSDHGFHLGEKHHWQKATLWEEATHCLLMMRVPGVSPADGGVCQRFVSLLDIYPTLTELCGLDAPDYLDGRSLVPLLKNPDAQWESTAITGLTSKGGPSWLPYITIRNETGRYIRYKDGQEEFYDTSKDPHEWTNEIDNPKYTAVLKKMKLAVPDSSELAVPLPNFVEKK